MRRVERGLGTGDRQQRMGVESESRGGDWRPFLFFGRMGFGKESGNSRSEILQVIVEANPMKLR